VKEQRDIDGGDRTEREGDRTEREGDRTKRVVDRTEREGDRTESGREMTREREREIQKFRETFEIKIFESTAWEKVGRLLKPLVQKRKKK